MSILRVFADGGLLHQHWTVLQIRYEKLKNQCQRNKFSYLCEWGKCKFPYYYPVLQIKYFIEFKMKMSIKKTMLKLVSAIFYQISIFHWIAFQKLWEIFFILSKKLFSFLRYSNFCNPVFPSFFPVCHCFRGWSK